jgi:hypothetical protein
MLLLVLYSPLLCLSVPDVRNSREGRTYGSIGFGTKYKYYVLRLAIVSPRAETLATGIYGKIPK